MLPSAPPAGNTVARKITIAICTLLLGMAVLEAFVFSEVPGAAYLKMIRNGLGKIVIGLLILLVANFFLFLLLWSTICVPTCNCCRKSCQYVGTATMEGMQMAFNKFRFY